MAFWNAQNKHCEEQGARVADIAAYIGDLESTTMQYYIAKRKRFIDSEGRERQIVTFPG